MKLLQSFLALIIVTTIGTMFLLTHPSITTLPMLARQPHFLQFPGTHRKGLPLTEQMLIRENRFESANQLPVRVFVGRNVYVPRPRQPQSHDVPRPRQPQSHDVPRPRQPQSHDVSRPRQSSHIGEDKSLNSIQVIKELLAKLGTLPTPTQLQPWTRHPVSPQSHAQQDVPWSFRRLRPQGKLSEEQLEKLVSTTRPPQVRELVSQQLKQQLHSQRDVPSSFRQLRRVEELQRNMELENNGTTPRLQLQTTQAMSHSQQNVPWSFRRLRPFEELQRNRSKEELEKLITSRSSQLLPRTRQPQQSRLQQDVPRSFRLRSVENLQRNMTEDDLEKKFPFQTKFSFPQPLAVKRRERIAQEQWVQDLRLLLSNVKSRQVSLVTSNIQYMDILLNWLISATVRSGMPLGSIIVVSLDRSLHQLLQKKAIPSVYLPPFSLLNPNAYFSVPFERVMMIRLTVMRIINHFGFDVANYDTDAIILRDPQPLYASLAKCDIIGSVGKIPEDLVNEWGITICIGVVVIKASQRSGECECVCVWGGGGEVEVDRFSCTIKIHSLTSFLDHQHAYT